MTKSKIFLSKILDKAGLKKKLSLWRFKDRKIVFTNGCFDILHLGHIHLLSKAADFGGVLVVGLNSDSSVKDLKGDQRPINDERTRSNILASLSYVDAVTIFNESTPIDLIQMVNPDVLVKGGDYAREDIVGADWVKKHNCSVEIIDLLEGYSTTNIEQKISHI